VALPAGRQGSRNLYRLLRREYTPRNDEGRLPLRQLADARDDTVGLFNTLLGLGLGGLGFGWFLAAEFFVGFVGQAGLLDLLNR